MYTWYVAILAQVFVSLRFPPTHSLVVLVRNKGGLILAEGWPDKREHLVRACQ